MIVVYRILVIIGFFVLAYFVGKKISYGDEEDIMPRTLIGTVVILVFAWIMVLMYSISCLLIK
jgi:hypothetical protein